MSSKSRFEFFRIFDNDWYIIWSIAQIDYPWQAMFGNKTCGADCDMDGVCPNPYPGATMGKCNEKGDCSLHLSNLGCKGNIVFSINNVMTKN